MAKASIQERRHDLVDALVVRDGAEAAKGHVLRQCREAVSDIGSHHRVEPFSTQRGHSLNGVRDTQAGTVRVCSWTQVWVDQRCDRREDRPGHDPIADARHVQHAFLGVRHKGHRGKQAGRVAAVRKLSGEFLDVNIGVLGEPRGAGRKRSVCAVIGEHDVPRGLKRLHSERRFSKPVHLLPLPSCTVTVTQLSCGQLPLSRIMVFREGSSSTLPVPESGGIDSGSVSIRFVAKGLRQPGDG